MSSQNIRAVEKKIMLDKERTLRFDLNTFCEIEEELGGINQAFDILKNRSLKGLRKLLWLGLKHEDETLTEEQVGAMVGISGIFYLTKEIADSFASSLPEEKN